VGTGWVARWQRPPAVRLVEGGRAEVISLLDDEQQLSQIPYSDYGEIECPDPRVVDDWEPTFYRVYSPVPDDVVGAVVASVVRGLEAKGWRTLPAGDSVPSDGVEYPVTELERNDDGQTATAFVYAVRASGQQELHLQVRSLC
jgi:hypothetical protein